MRKSVHMELKVKKLDPEAKLPTKGHPGDAGIDLYTLEEVVIAPGAQVRIRTGISIEIPEGHVGLMWDKSSISFNNHLKSMGGVIDAGFRGEVHGSLVNMSSETQVLKKGQKFTQMLVQRFEHCDIVETDTLSDTIRGSGREGSTGQN